MEKEGLIRSINFLTSNNLEIGTIVTDRHIQINKWIRENMLGVQHFFDVLHVAKGKAHSSTKAKGLIPSKSIAVMVFHGQTLLISAT